MQASSQRRIAAEMKAQSKRGLFKELDDGADEQRSINNEDLVADDEDSDEDERSRKTRDTKLSTQKTSNDFSSSAGTSATVSVEPVPIRVPATREEIEADHAAEKRIWEYEEEQSRVHSEPKEKEG